MSHACDTEISSPVVLISVWASHASCIQPLLENVIRNSWLFCGFLLVFRPFIIISVFTRKHNISRVSVLNQLKYLFLSHYRNKLQFRPPVSHTKHS